MSQIMYQLERGYFLRPLKESDVDGPYPSWFNDQSVCKYSSNGKFPKSRKDFIDYTKQANSEKRIVLAICDVKNKHIGNIALQNISLINRNAEFAIVLGDSEHHGKGVASQAGNILLHHGFNKLNLHRIYCGTAKTNIAMISLARKLGMQQEGCRRQHLFLEGEWVDMLEFGVLQEDFNPSLARKCQKSQNSVAI